MGTYCLKIFKNDTFIDDIIIKNINDENLQSIKKIVSVPFYPHCEILRSDTMKLIFWNYNITRSWFRN